MTEAKRLPTSADFSPNIILTITPRKCPQCLHKQASIDSIAAGHLIGPLEHTNSIQAPTGQSPANILVLLHGLGDSHVPFAKLGTQLNLPNTACIAIKAPNSLPFDPSSFHWCDDVIFDSTTQVLDPDGGFKIATPLLSSAVIQRGLVEKCGYEPRDIILFGLGQGGMAALNVAASMKEELGGIVSVGGPLANEVPASSSPRSKTPILVCSGVDSPWVTPGAEEKLKRNFDSVKSHRYKRKGDTMPQNRDEMLPVMQFFATRLRQAAPKGTIEIK